MSVPSEREVEVVVCSLRQSGYHYAANLVLRLQAENKVLEDKLAKAVETLERVMVGGNHLAIWLPDNHPTAEAEPLVALEQIGAGVSYDVWCCWRSIMQARATLAEMKGQNDE